MTEKLVKIQNELKAPKNQFNPFGKFKYRNQEDILEAVKPLLFKYGLLLTITDSVYKVGELNYVQAEVTVTDGEKSFTTTAQAGIDLNRKGMDIAQTFGSSSSYARKYALNGLFLIDDTKDADTANTHDKAPEADEKAWLNKNTPQYNKAIEFIKGGGDIKQVLTKYKMKKEIAEELSNLN
jgi:hypothetical protein